MIHEGQIVLFRFPQADQVSGKLRPALVLKELPGPHGDWLICMISSQLSQQTPILDEVLNQSDSDFEQSGLKIPSLIRAGRLAVVERRILLGAIGKIDPQRLIRIRSRLSRWLSGE